MANVARQRNQFQIAMSIFGALSVCVCTLVIVVILAYNKHRYSLRERIILGLMVANIVYSAASIVPTWYVDLDTCVYPLSQVAAAWTRSVWLWGKYWMVAYEVMIVCISIIALRTGKSTVPSRAETAAHTLSLLVGATAFAVFAAAAVPNSAQQDKDLSLSSSIEQELDALNASNQSGSITNQTRYVQLSEELTVIKDNLTTAAAEYFAYCALSVRIWIGPLVLSLLLWVASRVMYSALVRDWNHEFRNAEHMWLTSQEKSEFVHVRRQVGVSFKSHYSQCIFNSTDFSHVHAISMKYY